jgi:hypothetical protein
LLISPPHIDSRKTHYIINFFFNLSGAPKVVLDSKYRSVQKIKGGTKATLQAEVTGYPMPTVTWLKDNKPLASGDQITIETKPSGQTTLSLTGATLTNSGIYQIVAENNFGKDTAELEVSVTGKFELNFQTKSVKKPRLPIIVGKFSLF